MVDVTFLEVHLPEATFDASAPFSGASGSKSVDERESSSESSEEKDGNVTAMLLVLFVFAGLAWFLRRRTSKSERDDSSGTEEYDVE